MRTLSKQQLEDLVRGCTILGTGGGGSPIFGLQEIYRDLDAGRQFTMISLDDVPDEALVGAPYGCGSISPDEEEDEATTTSSSDEVTQAFNAMRAMETYLGKKFHAAMASEIGGGNTATALLVAARMGIPIVDADPSGRSVPEIQQGTFNIMNLPCTPISVATSTDDVLILERVADDFRAEEIVRSIAVVSGDEIGVVDHPVTGRVLRGAVIPGTLSLALHVGEAVRQARSSNIDPVQAAIEAGSGYLLFVGEIGQTSWKIGGGFTIGELTVNGAQSYRGHRYRIWFKNEHMISWFDDQPDVTVPDLICVLDVDSSETIRNPNAKEGMQVAVIGYPAPDMWRTPRGLELLGAEYFGFSIQYRPIEENPRLA